MSICTGNYRYWNGWGIETKLLYIGVKGYPKWLSFFFYYSMKLLYVLVLVSMEGNYGQKSIHLVFILLMLILLFSAFILYCFHIHADPISVWFSFIFYGLPNSILQYSLLICLNSYFYLCHKREFKHENQIALSIKTIIIYMNLMLHYYARR